MFSATGTPANPCSPDVHRLKACRRAVRDGGYGTAAAGGAGLYQIKMSAALNKSALGGISSRIPQPLSVECFDCAALLVTHSSVVIQAPCMSIQF